MRSDGKRRFIGKLIPFGCSVDFCTDTDPLGNPLNPPRPILALRWAALRCNEFLVTFPQILSTPADDRPARIPTQRAREVRVETKTGTFPTKAHDDAVRRKLQLSKVGKAEGIETPRDVPDAIRNHNGAAKQGRSPSKPPAPACAAGPPARDHRRLRSEEVPGAPHRRVCRS